MNGLIKFKHIPKHIHTYSIHTIPPPASILFARMHSYTQAHRSWKSRLSDKLPTMTSEQIKTCVHHTIVIHIVDWSRSLLPTFHVIVYQLYSSDSVASVESSNNKKQQRTDCICAYCIDWLFVYSKTNCQCAVINSESWKNSE